MSDADADLILVDPLTLEPLTRATDTSWTTARRSYPIVDGIADLRPEAGRPPEDGSDG